MVLVPPCCALICGLAPQTASLSLNAFECVSGCCMLTYNSCLSNGNHDGNEAVRYAASECLHTQGSFGGCNGARMNTTAQYLQGSEQKCENWSFGGNCAKISC